MNKLYKNTSCIFSLVMIVCLLMSFDMLSCFALSSKTPSIVIGSARGKAGDTVDVTITMSDNPGFVSANLYVNYDEDLLTLKNVKDGGLLSGVTHSDNYTSPYGLCWVNDLAKENFKVNGVLATLTFEISKNAKPGKTTISLEQDILDCDIENVVFELGNGSVEVTGASNSADSFANSSDNVQEGSDSSEKAVKSDSSQVSDGSSQEKNSNVQTAPDGENASSSVAENSTPNQNATTRDANKASSTQDSTDKGGSIALWICISALIIFAIIFVIIYVLHRRRQKQ